MKKALLLVVVLAAALGVAYLLLHKNSSSAPAEKRDVPLTVSANSSAFNRSFASMMEDYYKLSDAFADGDTAAIREKANKLSISVDSLKLNQLKADTAIIATAVSLAQSIPGEIAGLNGETKMEQKKREFYMVSEMLYNLIRTVRYTGGTIYHMECPMAFSDSSEAYWLSASSTIVNPYLGKNNPADKDKMPDGAKINDSIHFVLPQ